MPPFPTGCHQKTADNKKNNYSESVHIVSEQDFERVRLYTHPGHINCGAGLSRNLGIEKARGKFIAFLDADDFYLPNRFIAEGQIFKNETEVDGVYGAMGFHYYSASGKQKYLDSGYTEINTLSEKIPAEELCYSLLHMHNSCRGQFHLNTLTVKTEVFFGRTERFNQLDMHEDTVFLVQLSINCKLVPGEIAIPIAMYGVHDSNRIINNPDTTLSHYLYWKSLYKWSSNSNKAKSFRKVFQAGMMKEKLLLTGRTIAFIKFLWTCATNNFFLRKGIYFQTPAKYIFGERLAPYILSYKERIQQNIFKSNQYSSVMDDLTK